TLPATVSHGNSAASWNINAVRPCTSRRPAVGASRPATRFSSVDLPQPDAPTTHSNSPGATSRSMRSSAATGWRADRYTLETSRSATAGSGGSTVAASGETALRVAGALTGPAPAVGDGLQGPGSAGSGRRSR